MGYFQTTLHRKLLLQVECWDSQSILTKVLLLFCFRIGSSYFKCFILGQTFYKEELGFLASSKFKFLSTKNYIISQECPCVMNLTHSHMKKPIHLSTCSYQAFWQTTNTRQNSITEILLIHGKSHLVSHSRYSAIPYLVHLPRHSFV